VIPVARLPFFLPSLLLAACGGAPQRARTPIPPSAPVRTTAPAPSPANTEAANAVLFRAIDLVGTPYHFGGNTPLGGFDCSGLVGYVFRDAAQIILPRRAAQMSELPGATLDRDDLRSADLVFFRDRHRITHVGIYVGEQRFVHAPSTGGTVRLDSLDGHWWREHFAFGKRVIR
jgi:cell wall-associated NlpC family hydrolase